MPARRAPHGSQRPSSTRTIARRAARGSALSFGALLLAASLLASPAGCASEQSPAAAPSVRGGIDDLERPPIDFSLDVAVLTGSRVPPQTDAHRRPGHFILLSDGALLHDAGTTVTWKERPGRVRTLYQQQISDLWTLSRQIGFASPASADFVGNPALLDPSRDETIYVIAFSAAGERWTFVRGFRGDGEPDAASVRLIRALADLAWMQDLSRERFLPVRYDFGPDPYAGFRRRS